MSIAAAEPTSLVAFTLPGTPYSVRMARFYVRAALRHHNLGDHAENAQAITSELVTNAISHTGADAVGLELILLKGSGAIAIVVTDPCPLPPVMNDPAEDSEHGRGLRLVDALSACWGWKPRDSGKAVYAILTGETSKAGPIAATALISRGLLSQQERPVPAHGNADPSDRAVLGPAAGQGVPWG